MAMSPEITRTADTAQIMAEILDGVVGTHSPTYQRFERFVAEGGLEQFETSRK
jgi:hypothetical protein